MLTSLFNTPGLIPGIGIGILMGAAIVFGLLLAFEALEERASTRGGHTPPVPMPPPAWGEPTRNARTDVRSGPR